MNVTNMNRSVVPVPAAVTATPAPVWATSLAASVQIIICAGAIAGNGLFVAAVLLKKRLRTQSNIFLLNLSVTDLVGSLFLCVQISDSYIHRGWRWGEVYCAIYQRLHTVLLGTSLWLTCFVALNRYVYIVHHGMYRKFAKKTSVVLSLLFAWLLPTLVIWQQSVRAPQIVYSPQLYRCITAILPVWIISVLYYSPSVVATLCYILIFLFIRKSRLRVQAHGGGGAAAKEGPSRQEVRTVIVTMIVFFLVTLGYLPFVILLNAYKLTTSAPPPPVVQILLYQLLFLGAFVNPILYSVNNQNFRTACKEILAGKICRRAGAAGPLSTVSHTVPGSSNTNDRSTIVSTTHA